ncbi:hypothetical protein BOX15_Mlig016536g1 [Macrostomum lignano]|uniref:Uncharacterized protein n=1 Tax=Macrostomum lignano TaxID=282301 RepID=A0A267FZG0_9PLAT|nr:hypothetical protein BOX15_Mlig016536g1 [Macrostomum lignano]
MNLVEPNIPEDLHLGECQSKMWTAVESDDLPTVRKLINQWCRVDLAKGGMTLKDLALSRGTERIITLVIKMEPTLKFVNAVVDNRPEDVRRLFEKYSGSEIDVNFPNMRHSHATALLFAIRHRQTDLVAELLDRGARLDAPLTLPDQGELPLLFHAIRWDLQPDLIRVLMSRAAKIFNRNGQSLLDRVQYRGSWLLHWAVLADLPMDRLLLLVDFATPGVLCARNQKNQTFLDMARPRLRSHILQHKRDRFDPNDGKIILNYILRGFDLAWDIVPRDSLSPELVECATQLERHTYRFVCAVELGDSEAVQSLTAFEYQPLDYKCCVANCRNLADGQPPLHKAVLNRDGVIVRHLCEVLLHGMGIRLDSIRDNLGRTALCYAFACTATELPTTPEAEQPQCTADSISNLLLDHGCSEFATDWSDRTAQSFRDAARSSPDSMSALLQFHRAGDYRQSTLAEPGAVWIAVVASKRGDEGPKGRFAACCCGRNLQPRRRQDCRSGGGDCGAEGGNAGLSSGGGAGINLSAVNLHRHVGDDSCDCDFCDSSSGDPDAFECSCGML